ncbi:MAG: exo-alpha-sialidase [Verrucomicrobia bacterium]|nr:exo-alpha-sialidase [Verrucomicrobiota bacterium]
MFFTLSALLLAQLAATGQIIPAQKSTQILAASADMPKTASYLAFPALLEIGNEVLVSFKRGRSHGGDSGAVLDLLRLDAVTGKVKSRATLAGLGDQIMQMGEWVRFPNGDIASYIDAQQKAAPARIGLRVVRSRDGGKTFDPVERVGAVDGVEYGYAFEAITEGPTTWMLAMTFTNLSAGKSVYPPRPVSGSVDVIRSDDSGKTWRFVRNLTKEFSDIPINESSFARHGGGFIVAARGYDNRQWLLKTDGAFQLQRKVNLTSANTFIKSYVGRPRVFARDGGWYLMGRNYTDKGPMRLSLFRFDPGTLAITRHVLLDNSEGENVTDGYYAAPWWAKRDGRTNFNVVTYKGMAGRSPDIVRLEFQWEEAR